MIFEKREKISTNMKSNEFSNVEVKIELVLPKTHQGVKGNVKRIRAPSSLKQLQEQAMQFAQKHKISEPIQ